MSENEQLLLSDLRIVGPEKPIGYLPVEYVEAFTTMDELVRELIGKGLRVLILSSDQSGVFNGAFYVYDECALAKLLIENQKILEAQGWPIEPEAFVCYLKYEAPTQDIFNLIADAFGDKDNPLRTL
ncbi:MAG: hypothetical protein ACD_51C00333G0004 [uncultured bacterium]|nr:MAG: hypothetical protein ACD_51C00333G0004 [uncultured bacterium]OGJ47821.1 MAG: hypothetical protein A2344_01495 [Candidatus Peregrinibacteria bacterium RIFOXYB12_FULL_41_12]OGJ55330.1 MAG: hypothetical protein A2336_02490 [Candidatus Peregrinibacteria bacterium RIFOXYB2_FULL_41_88]